ncbi:protein kinase domain-containing protein [Polyangium aurulentum]|uniref:nSTAND1 domain-containing NTPase n=1 Tax=Polyangium aurulentum TaxID=2567896 RepID=UPI0010ADDD54|nr:protein kinase [Polyangium aurulentum]UQA55189.1 protein kinase [Polyangium aurulentum]
MDSAPRGEQSQSPDHELAFAPTSLAEPPQAPRPQTAARAATPLLTLTAPPSTEGHAPPDGQWPFGVGSSIKHYELIRKLGEGGMGVVFLARDTKLGRLVAIKVLLEHNGLGAERFLAEARATARCKHENIVVIHEVDEHAGYPYMVLEHLEGRTLSAFLAQREPSGAFETRASTDTPPVRLSPALAVDLMVPVVRALCCAHQLGIVHRDLKPENIFLTDAGLVKVLDFGIAKRLDADEITAIATSAEPHLKGNGLTEEGALLGTLPYMSPEQWLAEDIDPRSDLWAVGIILFELCTGTHPLSPVSMFRLAQVQVFEDPMPSVLERRPDVGPLGAIIDRCLRKPRGERFGSAEELLTALEALLPGRKALSPGEDDTPFAGLSAFQESDAARFFGRDRDVASILGRLRNQPLVAVAGPSGAGKSSFVRAGLIPALKRSGERWEAFLLRPGRRPLAALAEVLVQVSTISQQGAPSDAIESRDPEELVAVLRTQPGLFGARLRARCRRQGGQQRILVFVDQFEELYTLGTSADERAAFAACLEGAADDASSPLRVVLSIRSDFLDRMTDDRKLMTEVIRGLSFLPPVGHEGLREALTRPVEAAGYRFESEQMIEGMLCALARTHCPLPLLQFTAAKLWEARDRERRLLTQDSYDKLGGVAGALSTHADAVLAGLSSLDQRLCRAVFLRLVTPERTRAVVSLGELRALAEDSGAVEQVIQHLADARLLLIETSGERDGTTVELVHESLIDRWSKLGQWLDEGEQDAHFMARLRAAAQQWEASGQAEGLLWRDHAAEEAHAWLERQRAEQGVISPIGGRDERYLLAVVALSERERRVRWRIAAGVVATLTAISLVVSVLAGRASREAARADEAAALAQDEAREMRNTTRMATAREMLESDPTTALALLRDIEPPGVPRGWADLTQRALHSGLTLVVLPHKDSVFSTAWSPDGKHIASASRDKLARIWRADGAGEPLLLRGHDNAVNAVGWSPDGKRVVTASDDRTARVWNADGTGKPLVLRGHEEAVSSAAWSADGKRIVTASADRTMRVWNADGTGEPLVLRGHDNAVLWAEFSPDGKHIVSASADRTARMWNADGTGRVLVLLGHEGKVRSVGWSPDGKRIVTGSEDRTAQIWNSDGTGEPVILRGHEGWVRSVEFSRDGKHIVTTSDDKRARVYDANGLGEPWILRGHEAWARSAEFSPDGRFIATASSDRTVRIWSAKRTDERLTFRGHEGVVSCVAWSGERILTASEDGTARVWNASGTGEPVVLRGHEEWVSSAAFSADGKRIVTASHDRTARVWNADGTGEPVVLRGHESVLNSAAFSPDGKRVVTASQDRTARIWNADGTGEPRVLVGHEGEVRWAAWSPDGEHIITTSSDRTVRIWNAHGTGEPRILRGHDHWVESVAFSPDGKRIVTASVDKTARVWNVDGTGEPLVLRGHEGWVRSAAWSPDGKRIVTASVDKTVRVWNAEKTDEALVLRGHDGWVSSAAWSPDGKRIVTASDDRTVQVWDDLTPVLSPEDPKLWAATPHCMPIELTTRLLSLSESAARAERQACERRTGGFSQAIGGP